MYNEPEARAKRRRKPSSSVNRERYKEQADGKAAQPGLREQQAHGGADVTPYAPSPRTGIRGDIASDHDPTDPTAPRR